jgi:hypothetical protein
VLRNSVVADVPSHYRIRGEAAESLSC